MDEKLIVINRLEDRRIRTDVYEGMEGTNEIRVGIILADALRTVCQYYNFDPKTVMETIGREVEAPTSEIFRSDPETGKTVLEVVKESHDV